MFINLQDAQDNAVFGSEDKFLVLFSPPRDVTGKNFVDQWLHQAQENGTTKALMNKWME